MAYAEIAGVGLYAPERVVTNDFFDRLYNRDMDTFLREQRNITERHFMAPEQATSDLILPAARQAMSQAQVQADDLDLIIVATDTPDYISPATAAVVQYRLGAKRAGAFDVNSACAGFVTALDMANKYMTADSQYRTVLVVGAYGMSKYLNWDDYKIASMFADGAGAVVLKAQGETPSFLASQMYADGQYHDYMGVYAGGTRTPITHQVIEDKQHLLNFAKKIPLETNVENWPRLTWQLLDRIGKTPQDIDVFFITQINIGLIQQTLDRLGLAHDKSHNVMNQFGYTGSACIPMAMADAVAKKKLKKGDLVFLLGSGGGVTMSALALEWRYDTK